MLDDRKFDTLFDRDEEMPRLETSSCEGAGDAVEEEVPPAGRGRLALTGLKRDPAFSRRDDMVEDTAYSQAVSDPSLPLRNRLL